MTARPPRLRLPVAWITVAALLMTAGGPTLGATGPTVTGFTLINAATDRPISGFDPIRAGATINLAALPTRDLNIRVNATGGVGSVRISLNGGAARVENQPPYAMAGDLRGNFHAWTPASGSHTVTATAYSLRDAQGAAGPTSSVSFSVVNTATTTGGTTTSGATPTSTPAPATPTSSQCGPMPSAAPAGWRRVLTDSFNENIPLGEWGKPGGRWEFPGGVWKARPAGYKDSSGRATYNSMKTTSQHDGLLDVWVHNEGSTRYVAAPMPRIGATLGQRISICMRADVIPGYKIAFLLWPTEGTGNSRGEIDYPEGRLAGAGTSAHAFMHYDPKPASGKSQDAYDSGVTVQGWHEYVLEWNPKAGYAAFYHDGRLLGRSTRYVPRSTMFYVMQIESYVSSQPLPAYANGHVLVDWVTVEVPSS